MKNEECRMKNTNTMSKVKCILHSTFFILNLSEALILHSERSVLTSLNFKR